MNAGEKKELPGGTNNKRQLGISMLLIAMLFFVFGFVSWVNAILIPYFKIACELTHFDSYLVAFAFYISYFIWSVPAGRLLQRIGFKSGMRAGFWVMSLGALLFVPAAAWRSYPVFLLGLFIIGAGLAVLQTAANPYITLLGKPESAARRISIMGICNKSAGILAPLLFAAVILRDGDDALFAQIPSMPEAIRNTVLDELIRRVMLPYAIVAIVLFLLGVLIWRSPLPEVGTRAEASGQLRARTILGFPHLVLGAVAIFLHVGTQVIAIDTVINYAGSMGIPLSKSRVFPSYTLFATIIGYIVGIAGIPHVFSQLNALRFCTLLGLVLSILIQLLDGSFNWMGYQAHHSIGVIVSLGFANSLVWAGIWPLALKGLGNHTQMGASLLIMGLCGNALLPLLYGQLADVWGLRLAYLVLIPCYLYLVFYAFYGYRARRWRWTKQEAI